MPGGASNADEIKSASGHLRGRIGAGLQEGGERFEGDDATLLKFHGIYQQDDRDQRRARTAARAGLAYQFMVRVGIPGGVASAEQWLAMDALADEVGGGALRLTTREGVQYHGVHKGELRRLITALDARLLTTFAACGDVVRNVAACPAPHADGRSTMLAATARRLAARLRPQTTAYWELWVDGDKAATREPRTDTEAEAGTEPLYGATYLPRKFKVSVAWPGDNCVDALSQDVALVPAPGPGGGEGFTVFAGGGLGASHADPTTFPRLADALAWCPVDDVEAVVTAIVGVHRDHGNRDDRQHARLKYVVEDKGIAWVRAEVEQRVGHSLADPEPVDLSEMHDHLGWHPQDDGRWFVGVHVESGRVRDTGEVRLKAAVAEAARRFATEVRITARQDLLLCGVDEADRDALDALLAEHGVIPAGPQGVARTMLACPALPTCGQALGEAERVAPQWAERLDKLIARSGLGDLVVETRMTGCPNGCARPYTAEIGIVGRTKKGYDLWVGGSPGGTRIARRLATDIRVDGVDDVLGPVLERFRVERDDGEAFGDWAGRARVGSAVIELRQAAV